MLTMCVSCDARRPTAAAAAGGGQWTSICFRSSDWSGSLWRLSLTSSTRMSASLFISLYACLTVEMTTEHTTSAYLQDKVAAIFLRMCAFNLYWSCMYLFPSRPTRTTSFRRGTYKTVAYVCKRKSSEANAIDDKSVNWWSIPPQELRYSLTVMTGTFETVGRLQIAFLPWVLLSLVMPVCPSTGGIKVSVRCKSRHCLSSQANQASGSTGRIAALKLDGNLDF